MGWGWWCKNSHLFGELLKPYGVYILLKILEYEISIRLNFRKKNFINSSNVFLVTISLSVFLFLPSLVPVPVQVKFSCTEIEIITMYTLATTSCSYLVSVGSKWCKRNVGLFNKYNKSRCLANH